MRRRGTSGPKKQTMTAIFLTPVAITKDNLERGHRRRMGDEGRGLPGRESRLGEGLQLG